MKKKKNEPKQTNERKLTPEEERLISQAFRSYYKDLYLYAASHTKNVLPVEDIVSETFTVACEKIETFKEHPNKKGWLLNVAHFKILETYRRLHASDMLYTEDMEELADLSSPYADCRLRLTVKDVLTAEEYLRFRRYFVWGYSLEEMAALEHVSKSNMSAKLSRLRKKLRRVV